MKNRLLYYLFLLISFNVSSQNQIYIEKSDCFLKNCEPFKNAPNVEFGYIHVPENYDDPNSGTIKVAFSIVKSTVEDPEPDPILIFGGGWGVPSVYQTNFYQSIIPVKNRDLILYDYRGSGFSTPNLCPDLGNKHWETIQQNLNYEEFTEQLKGQFYDCFEELEEQGIDYRNYGTAVKTIDAVKLVEQLGYETVNLFGISNGTMGIQGFIRAAESSLVKIRSIYSDSNVPMVSYRRGDESVVYKDVLEKILNDCSNDPQCESTYPNLKERFFIFIKESLHKPQSYKKDEIEIVFNTYEINSVIHQMLYSESSYKDIPLLLEAIMDGELGFFDLLLSNLKDLVVTANGTSVINYTYDWKAGQDQETKKYEQTKNDYPEFIWSDFWLDFFVTDTTITYNPSDTVPVTSSVPALVVAGTYDPITPPELSRIMGNRYSNSYYYELSKLGHGVVTAPCGNELFKAFIEQPDVRPKDDCVKTLAALSIPFVTSIYTNTSISRLLVEVGFRRNILWIMLLILPMILSLVYLIREFVRVIRKKGFNASRSILSISVLFFLGGLAYYSLKTINLGGLTLLFGLAGSAWWLPWFTAVILFSGLSILFKMLRTSNYGFWNIGLLISTVMVLITAFAHGIYPFY